MYRAAGDKAGTSQCYEKVHNYRQAVECLCEADLYESALGVVERYTLLEKKDRDAYKIARAPKKERTIESLVYHVAEMHLRQGNVRKMEIVVQRLPSKQDQIAFLKKHGRVERAANLMIQIGKRDDAALLLLRNGQSRKVVDEGIANDPKINAQCLISYARSLSTNTSDDEIKQTLEKARGTFVEMKDLNGVAEVDLALGKLMKDPLKLASAKDNFRAVGNIVGQLECCEEWVSGGSFKKVAQNTLVFDLLSQAASLSKTLGNLARSKGTAIRMEDKTAVDVCEHHFGLSLGGQKKSRIFHPKTFCRMASLDGSSDSKDEAVTIEEKAAWMNIAKYIRDTMIQIVRPLRTHYRERLEELKLCGPFPDEIIFKSRFYLLLDLNQLDDVAWKIYKENKNHSNTFAVKTGFLPKSEFESCEEIYDLIFPKIGGIVHLTGEDLCTLENLLKGRFEALAKSLCENATPEDRASVTDLATKVTNLAQLASMDPDLLYKLKCKLKWLKSEEDKLSKTHPEQIPSNVGVVSEKVETDPNPPQAPKPLLERGNVVEASHNGIRMPVDKQVMKKAKPLPSICLALIALVVGAVACYLSLLITLCCALFITHVLYIYIHITPESQNRRSIAKHQ